MRYHLKYCKQVLRTTPWILLDVSGGIVFLLFMPTKEYGYGI